MPPNMVIGAQAELDAQGAHATATQPLLATSQIPQHLQFPLTKWRPRTGLTMTQFKWRRDVNRLLAAFGLQPSAVLEEQPQIHVASPPSRTYPNTRIKTESDAADEQLVADQTDKVARWQRVNTAIYWHVLPSIEIDGAHFLDDSATVDSYSSGQLANGRGLVQWALGFVDVSEFAAQLLISNELGSVKLKADATLAQLAVHLQKMQQVWLLTTAATATTETDGAAALGQLYEYILRSMPTTYSNSAGMHLVSLRTWFADRVTEFKSGGGQLIDTFKKASQVLLRHGATLGVVSGTAVPEGNLLAVLSKPDGVTWKLDWAGKQQKVVQKCMCCSTRAAGRGAGGFFVGKTGLHIHIQTLFRCSNV